MCEHLKRSVFVRLYLFLVLKADFAACLCVGWRSFPCSICFPPLCPWQDIEAPPPADFHLEPGLKEELFLWLRLLACHVSHCGSPVLSLLLT